MSGWIFVCVRCGKRHDFGIDHPYPCEICGNQTWAEKGWMRKQGCLVVEDERQISEKIHILSAAKSQGGVRITTDDPTVQCFTCTDYWECREAVEKLKVVWPKNCNNRKPDGAVVIFDERLI